MFTILDLPKDLCQLQDVAYVRGSKEKGFI